MTTNQITSLYFPELPSNFTATDIIENFYSSNIATIDKIAFQPFVEDQRLYYKAYVDIHKWHNTSNAKEFIELLNNSMLHVYYTIEDCRFEVMVNKKPWMTVPEFSEWQGTHITKNFTLQNKSKINNKVHLCDYNTIQYKQPYSEYNDTLNHTYYEVPLDIV